MERVPNEALSESSSSCRWNELWTLEFRPLEILVSLSNHPVTRIPHESYLATNARVCGPKRPDGLVEWLVPNAKYGFVRHSESKWRMVLPQWQTPLCRLVVVLVLDSVVVVVVLVERQSFRPFPRPTVVPKSVRRLLAIPAALLHPYWDCQAS